MAKIVGMGGDNNPPIQKPKLDLSQAKEISCQECGGTVFIPGTKFLKISKMIARSRGRKWRTSTGQVRRSRKIHIHPGLKRILLLPGYLQA